MKPSLLLPALCLPPALARAVIVDIPAARDNTLYESATGALANGAGEFLFAGRTNQASDSTRRALIEFDIQSLIPAGSVINSATLILHVSMARPAATQVSVHRLTRAWSEGLTDALGNEGAGGSPVLGDDATWLHAVSPGTLWTAPGAAGDFTGTASSSALITGVSFVSWTGLAGDVQGWLANGSTNHGWIVIGDESAGSTAIRFESRTSPQDDNVPVLRVDYTAVPEPAVAGLTLLAFAAFGRRRR